MSLEQYKDANRKELWAILQIQVERIAELDAFKRNSLSRLSASTKYIDEQVLRITELEEERGGTDPLLKELLYCCDGLYCDYAQENYGDAKNWLRHINAAYGKYRDAIDDLEALKETK
jgi:hypothetical protein